MSSDYDALIAKHYREVAEADGLSPSSTMAYEIIRQTETEAIVAFAEDAAGAITGRAPRIADVGCGNGYTLGVLSRRLPQAQFTGIELSDDLRALAERRVAEDGLDNVTIAKGDIREPQFAGSEPFDIIICQRVLINLMDLAHQRLALGHIVATLRAGGALLCIEGIQSGLDLLNEARDEFGLPPIPPAYHNVYLPDDFFEGHGLGPYESAGWTVPPNALSTHYFVSRVLYPALLGDGEIRPNSHFVKFFSAALPPDIGDYAQLRILAFRKEAA